ncbi:class D beta-lactamase [Catenovulum sp. SM1970]|uniref:class D beta-lactamase n=1 Tax=Marinifaba aquimaris TaxID=2741323 RepID=UPI00157446C4|nr:class D beta-lactamase [Marinifaba aquimaris]NTS77179.1 class D beta-lactamase [Marinifaba aquimaris]
MSAQTLIRSLIATFSLLCTFTAFAQQAAPHKPQPLCQSECAMLIKAKRGDYVYQYNHQRISRRYTPFSSFKIANTLIALDSGKITSLNQPLTFDLTKYPVEKWWPKIWYQAPVDIRTAFQSSALPVYQQLALEMGAKTVQQYVDQFDYGNKDISSGIDSFWLNGSIEISAAEQVELIANIEQQNYPLKATTYSLFKQVMLVEKTDDYALYAKTGTGPVGPKKYIGWYVGYIERADNTFYFAFNLDGTNFKGIVKERVPTAKKILKQQGLL